jgi:hypothetical protein
MPVRQADSRDADLLDIVVDQDAEPLDLDRFLDALDRLVERRLSQCIHSTPGGTPAAVDLTTGDEGRDA